MQKCRIAFRSLVTGIEGRGSSFPLFVERELSLMASSMNERYKDDKIHWVERFEASEKEICSVGNNR